MNKKRSVYNITIALVGQVISLVISLFIPRLFIMGYGSEVQGFTNSVTQIYTYLALLEAGVGVATVQALYKAVAESDRDGISGIISATNKYYKKVGVAYLVSIVIFALVYALAVKSDIAPLTVVGVIFFSGAPTVVNYLYQAKYSLLMTAEGKNYVSTGFYTLANVLSAAGKLVCILLRADLLVIFLVFSLLSASQVVFFRIYIRRRYAWVDLKAPPDFASVSQKSWVLVQQVAALVFSNAHILILTATLGLKYVSVYSVYRLVTSIIFTLLYNVSVSVYYILGQTYNTDRDKYIRLIDTYETYRSAVGFGLLTVAYLLLLPFVTLYTDGATDIRYVFALYPLLFVLPELLNVCRDAGANTINFAKHFKATAGRCIAESAINIVGSLALVYVLGIPGLLIASAAALLYRANDVIIYSNRRILGRSPGKSYKVCAVNFALFAVIAVIFRFVPLHIDSYLSLFVWGAILCAVILPVYLVAGSLACPGEYRYLNAFLRPRLKRLLSRRRADG